jgi:hypothetical protein
MPHSMEDLLYLEKYKKQLREYTATDEAIIAARNQRIRYRIAQGKSDSEALVLELELLDMLGYHYQYGTQRKSKIKNISYSKKAKKYMEFFANPGDILANESKIIDNVEHLNSARSATTVDTNTINGLTITSFILNGIYLLGLPFIALLAKARGEPIPFDTSDKIKWGISTVMLALGIVSFTVPPVGFAIGLALTSFGAAMSLYGLITYARDRRKLVTTKIIPNQIRIDQIATIIKTNINQINDFRHEIRRELGNRHPDNLKIINLEKKIKTLEIENERNNERLLIELKARRKLEIDRSPEKTLFTLLSTSVRIALIGVSIAGIVLSANPFTAPIGAIMLTTVAAVMIANFIVTKIHQGRMAKINRASKTELDTEHKKVMGLDKISPSFIIPIKPKPRPAKDKLSRTNSGAYAAETTTSIIEVENTPADNLNDNDKSVNKPKSSM